MGRKKTITDLVEAQVLGAYVIQSLGKATSPEAIQAMERGGGLAALSVSITEERLVNALRALQSRGLVSINHELREAENVKVRVYSLTRAAWSSPPEIATFTKLLPVLVQTAEAEELKCLFDDEEVKTRPGERKRGRLPDIRDYVHFELDFVTMEPLYGGQPLSPGLHADLKGSRHKPPFTIDPKASQLFFERDAITGALLIHSHVLRGWIGTHARMHNMNASVAQYVGVRNLLIEPHRLVAVQRPIQAQNSRGGGGAGLAVYEVIPAGQELTLSVKVPTCGGNMPSAEGWVDFFADIAENPMRSISPARGRATGRMTLTAARQLVAAPRQVQIERVTLTHVEV